MLVKVADDGSRKLVHARSALWPKSAA
jgi:hypothetical protein